MSTYKDLFAFRKAFELAMKIFEISKPFPKEETYSLTDQLEEVQDRCVPILLKHFGERNTRHIS